MTFAWHHQSKYPGAPNCLLRTLSHIKRTWKPPIKHFILFYLSNSPISFPNDLWHFVEKSLVTMDENVVQVESLLSRDVIKMVLAYTILWCIGNSGQVFGHCCTGDHPLPGVALIFLQHFAVKGHLNLHLRPWHQATLLQLLLLATSANFLHDFGIFCPFCYKQSISSRGQLVMEAGGLCFLLLRYLLQMC